MLGQGLYGAVQVLSIYQCGYVLWTHNRCKSVYKALSLTLLLSMLGPVPWGMQCPPLGSGEVGSGNIHTSEAVIEGLLYQCCCLWSTGGWWSYWRYDALGCGLCVQLGPCNEMDGFVRNQMTRWEDMAVER